MYKHVKDNKALLKSVTKEQQKTSSRLPVTISKTSSDNEGSNGERVVEQSGLPRFELPSTSTGPTVSVAHGSEASRSAEDACASKEGDLKAISRGQMRV